MLLLLRCSSCTLREERVYNALDRGRVNIVDDAKGLLPICVPLLCCCLQLPLSDCVPVVLVAAAVVFRLPLIAIVGSCSGCTWREGCHGDKDVDIGRVDVVDAAKGLLRKTNKETRVRL